VEPRTPVRHSRRKITLRSLAMQSSGLPRETPAGDTEREILAAVGDLPLLHPQFSGTTHYSNLGLAILGRALEKVSRQHGLGHTWEEYMVNQILVPLGMRRSGVYYNATVTDWLVDGVDPRTGQKQAVPCPTCSSWDAPAGQLFSTSHDMANWIAWLNGQGSPFGDWDEEEAAAVLDPQTRIEMQHSAVVHADGSSAIGGATYEMAYMRNRWSMSKLGCENGYRSDITLVPSLELGIFGAAASTCDFYGDGDAVVFPVVSAILPALEEAMQQEAIQALKGDAPVSGELEGQFKCDDSTTMQVVLSQGILRLQPGPEGYPFILQHIEELTFRIVMASYPNATTSQLPCPPPFPRNGPCTVNQFPGFLDPSVPSCLRTAYGNNNLCPISCMREMMRDDTEIAVFQKNQKDSGEVVLRFDGLGTTCKAVR